MSGALFDLPDMQRQDSLLALEPVSQKITAKFANPVARVLLNMPQPHMDQLFDYEIPEKYADVPLGARVQVEVGARKVDGFLIERTDLTLVGHKLRPLHRVYSYLAVFPPATYQLCRNIARQQISSRAAVAALAVPRRHARVEKEFDPSPVVHPNWTVPEPSSWNDYPAGAEFLAELPAGSPRAAVQMLPGHNAVDLIIPAVQATLSGGRGVQIVAPTPVAAARYQQKLAVAFPGERIALFTSQQAHADRYLNFLKVLTGQARIVVGTRVAAWAPLPQLGLAILLDDQHSAHAEPRNPYVHTRQILREACDIADAAFLALNYGPTVALAEFAATGWLRQLSPAESKRRTEVAQIMSANDFRLEGLDVARMPSAMFAVVRAGLENGSVLILVPRSGYLTAVSCNACRELARCPYCEGQLEIPGPRALPKCTRCSSQVDFVCPNCGGKQLRAVRIGSQRTAQEIGRAFPGTVIQLAGVGESSAEITGRRIVVATPGVIPPAQTGYAAGVVLDARYLLHANRLESEGYFLRDLAHMAHQVRPRRQKGKILVVGDISNELITVAARWDFAAWSAAQLQQRASLALPPTATWVELLGPQRDIAHLLSTIRTHALDAGRVLTADIPLDALLSGGIHDLIPGMAVLGPRETRAGTVAYLRFPHADREANTALIAAAVRENSIHHSARAVRVRIDPQL
ncbi:MAG: hypothetical protein Q4E03_04340 [Trueperella sp.]|nr:hypothetical protein [Trueperella sp.]